MQYVGDTKYYKVFIDVSKTFISKDDTYTILQGKERIISPIAENLYQHIVNHIPCSGRYQLTMYRDVFIADEAHRDSHAFHVPGFHIIKNLELGDIIPKDGFKTDKFLSDGDKLIMSDAKMIGQFTSGMIL